MLPLYLAWIEDLRRGDLVKVDCATCHHVALLTPDFCCNSGVIPEANLYLSGWQSSPAPWARACLRRGWE